MSAAFKKYFVLVILFVFPIVIYLFFASGKNNFALLPILTEEVNEINEWETLSGEVVNFKNNISVLGFWGSEISVKRGDALNLNQKIYKRFYQFEDFQFVMILQKGEQEKVIDLKEALREGAGTDLVKWKFVFGTSEQIQSLFNSLKSPLELSAGLSSPYVFLIDKDSNLRGRDDDQGMLYGFNSQSVAEINNKMIDDVKVILAEYRRAWKKYNRTETSE
jgi:hypothetical protein